MVAVKTIRSRGANIVVQANGEVVFAPGTDVSRWKNFFSGKIQRATQTAAPTNRRPRWDHYGKPLKTTILAETRTRITRGGGFFYIIVGSTAPHAYYVDQGTGVYAGNGPYQAAVLPPYRRGGPNLYEKTWRPGGPGSPVVNPVFIKGQKPQNFFDTGLKNGFRAMRMRSFQLPGEGASAITSALNSIPVGMANFLGNTRPDAGFIASLEEWRIWRDTAYNAGRELGTRGGKQYQRSTKAGTRKSRATGRGRRRRTEAEDEQRRAKSRERSQRYRDAKKVSGKPKRPPKARTAGGLTRKQDRTRVLNLARRRFGAKNIESVEYVGGKWQVVIKTESPNSSGNIRPEYKSYSIPARS